MALRILFCLPFLLATPLFATLVDRLVLEINGVYYAQSQVESYLACKGLLDKRSLNQASWRQQLETFRADMLIDQEALRLAAIPVDVRQVDALMSKGSTLCGKEAANRVIRVRAFAISRERGSLEAQEHEPWLKSDWYMKAEKRANDRYMDGALEAQILGPLLP